MVSSNVMSPKICIFIMLDDIPYQLGPTIRIFMVQIYYRASILPVHKIIKKAAERQIVIIGLLLTQPLQAYDLIPVLQITHGDNNEDF